MLPKQNWVGKLTFLLSSLYLKISFPFTNKELLSALRWKLKQSFVFALVKLILNFYSGETKLPLIPKVWFSPNIKNLVLRLSEWDDELLSTPKTITYLAVSLLKYHQPARWNVTPYPLYTYLSLWLFFSILVTLNKQFLNLK